MSRTREERHLLRAHHGRYPDRAIAFCVCGYPIALHRSASGRVQTCDDARILWRTFLSHERAHAEPAPVAREHRPPQTADAALESDIRAGGR